MEFESGKVIYFDRSKQCGFVLSAGGERIYFRYQAGRMVQENVFADEPELSRDYFVKRGVGRKFVDRPKRGEELYFVREDGPLGPRAKVWCFAVRYRYMQERICRHQAADKGGEK